MLPVDNWIQAVPPRSCMKGLINVIISLTHRKGQKKSNPDVNTL